MTKSKKRADEVAAIQTLQAIQATIEAEESGAKVDHVQDPGEADREVVTVREGRVTGPELQIAKMASWTLATAPRVITKSSKIK